MKEEVHKPHSVNRANWMDTVADKWGDTDTLKPSQLIQSFSCKCVLTVRLWAAAYRQCISLRVLNKRASTVSVRRCERVWIFFGTAALMGEGVRVGCIIFFNLGFFCAPAVNVCISQITVLSQWIKGRARRLACRLLRPRGPGVGVARVCRSKLCELRNTHSNLHHLQNNQLIG